MSVVSSYLIHIYTGVDYEAIEYDTAAAKLHTLLTDLLSQRGTISTLTHHSTIDACASEIEVLM